MDSTGLNIGSATTIPLPAGGHVARFVSEIFPGLSSFHGTLAVAVPTSIAALTLRQNSSPLSYTTLPVVSGTASGTSPPAPLLPATATGIRATANVVVNQILAAAFRISGKIGGPRSVRGIQAQNSSGEMFVGQIDFTTGRYVIAVKPGTYTLKVFFADEENGEVTTWAVDPTPVQVSGDVARDVTLPPKVEWHKVTLTFGGRLPNDVFGHHELIFTSVDGTVFGYFDQTTPRVPDGTYRVSRKYLNHVLFDLGTVTVRGADVAADLPVPVTVKLAGKITVTNAPVPPQAQIVAVDTTAPSDTAWAEVSGGFLTLRSTVSADGGGQYSMDVISGRSYTVRAAVPAYGLAGIDGTLTVPHSPDVLTLSRDTVLDFNLPAIPGYVTISGRVTDTKGQGVKDVRVEAVGKGLTGAPNAMFGSSTTTDPNGNYRIAVISGENYDLKFVPPVAKPSPF